MGDREAGTDLSSLNLKIFHHFYINFVTFDFIKMRRV